MLLFKYLFSKEKPECFICCSVHGKTEEQLFIESQYQTRLLNYPLIQLSDAYECNCKMYAHNICLFKMNFTQLHNQCSVKCPTCRKEQTPHLYVKTWRDTWIPWLLRWVKQDVSRINTIQRVGGITLITLCLLLCLLAKNKANVDYYIPPNSIISLLFGIIIAIIHCISVYLFTIPDYFDKYWLYHPNRNICYIPMPKID
jgi:hypothetical protein